MRHHLALPAILFVLWATVPAAAQAPRVEASVLGGWTLSDGVTGEPATGLDGNVYARIEPKDAFSWGLGLALRATEHAEFGFLYGRQQSALEVGGPARTVEVGDLGISTYHGYVAYNFGASDAKVRPYVLAGLGATSYGSVRFTGLNGQARETSGDTQGSPTIGAGVKVYTSPRLGLRFGARITPTFVKSDVEGWWCDPFWGCFVVEDPQYSTQLELSGGVVFRF